MTKNKALNEIQGKEKNDISILAHGNGVGESQPLAQEQGGVNNA